MMENSKKKILLTGLTGFIGRHVAGKIYESNDIFALIRPQTERSRFSEFENKINFIEIDLSNTDLLSEYLENNSFDYILHIGALRGGRKFSQDSFIKTNFDATKLLMENAIKNNSRFIFCSSVGVYGAIPNRVPADLDTEYKRDNLYHTTKIRCEEMILQAIAEKNLQACIVRPAITYGEGDYGFPYTLMKLVDKKLLFLPIEDIFIHLTNVNLITDVFCKLLQENFPSGKIFNVADKEKVSFHKLADFIYSELKGEGKKYPKYRRIMKKFFEFHINLFKILKNELWVSRFELISENWYFDVQPVYETLNPTPTNTIPDFKIVTDWYKTKGKS